MSELTRWTQKEGILRKKRKENDLSEIEQDLEARGYEVEDRVTEELVDKNGEPERKIADRYLYLEAENASLSIYPSFISLEVAEGASVPEELVEAYRILSDEWEYRSEASSWKEQTQELTAPRKLITSTERLRGKIDRYIEKLGEE